MVFTRNGTAPSPREWENRWREHGHDLLQLLVDGLSDVAVFLIDAEGRIATWNSGAARIKGYTAEEIIGQSYATFYPEDEAAKGTPAQVLATAARLGRYQAQGWRVRKDGSRFWADVIIDAIRDEDGELLGFAKVTRDLTEQKAREDELRASEARFRLLVDAVVDYAIFWLDPEGRVSSWNAGAQRIKGYTAREIVGRPYGVFWPPEDRQAGLPQQALRQAERWGRFQGEGWRVRKDGSRFWASVVIDRITDAEGKLLGFAKITRDETERRKADLALREAHDQLEVRVEERTREAERRARDAEAARAETRRALEKAEAASRAKSRFFNAASHDLRQPIQALRLFVDVLAGRLRGGPHEPITQKVQESLASAESLLESLLDVARIESGAVVPAPVELPLADVLEAVVQEFDLRATAKGLALRYIPPTGRTVVSDPLLLQRILRNFLENAVKYTETGRILVGCRCRGGGTAIEVWDTGMGIDEQHLRSIWDEFFQVGNPARERREGLGLGLSIAQKLAGALGHHLEVQSCLGKGSVFRVVIDGSWCRMLPRP